MVRLVAPRNPLGAVVAFADAAITVYLLGAPAAVALGLLHLFVVPGVYVTFVHGFRLVLAHLGYLVAVVVGTYTYVLVSTDTSVVVATLFCLLALTGGVTTSIMAHIALTFLRRHAHESFTDPLTGILNRRGLLDALMRSHEVYPPSAPVTALVIDIDKFKAINDAHGHLTGDQVLARTAQRLTEVGRNVDALARIGGDEFAIFTHLDAHRAGTFAEQLRRSLTADVDIGSVSVSIGTVTTALEAWPPPDDDTIEEMLDYADTAMYHAKNAGGNRAVAASPQRLRRRRLPKP